MSKLPDGRDGNFVCFCGGDIAHVRTLENGRRVFKCGNGDIPHEELMECIVCHLPKTIWADDGTICGGCGMKFLTGELVLTEDQIKGMEKWKITIRI